MLINILSARTFKAHCFTYPIRVFADQIEELRLSVKLYFRPDSSLFDCDVLCIVSEHFRGKIGHSQSAFVNFLFQRQDRNNLSTAIGLLKKYRHQARSLIWFDVSDSTGTPFFEVLPIVNLYAKNQLLKDRLLYCQEFYGTRYYTDYYHRIKGIADKHQFRRGPARREELNKLAVSWNIGMGDYRTHTKWGRRLRIFWPGVNHGVKATSSEEERKIDISYRASSHYRSATVSFQREETRRQLEKLAVSGKSKIVYDGKLPYREYIEEMRSSLIVLSPFGNGVDSS